MDLPVMPLRTALYVDFDNVFLGLRDQDPQLAEVFGREPERWLSWAHASCTCRPCIGTEARLERLRPGPCEGATDAGTRRLALAVDRSVRFGRP